MKVAIMAGGTGGHIFPGLAVAHELMKKEVSVVWLGAVGGMEEDIISQNNIPLKLLSIKGIRGKGALGLLSMPFKLVKAILTCMKYFKTQKVNAVISMGGYVAGPGGVAAKLKGIPLLVHEQNSTFGMTNKYLAKWSKKTLTGFNLNGLYHSQWIGNPVREEIENCEKAINNSGKINVFVLGGSLGANSLNTRLPETLIPYINDNKISVKHQCGKNHQKTTQEHYRNIKYPENIEVIEFIKSMQEMYVWADIIISRAGALTIAEINAVGLPAILVPYPYAVDDHQTSNAMNIVENKAGFIWQESQEISILEDNIKQLITDAKLRKNFAIKSKKLHKPQSALKVAEICLEMVK